MLGRRRRRWFNIGPTLGQCVVFAGILIEITRLSPKAGRMLGPVEEGRPIFTQLWVIARYSDPMLAQCWTSFCDAGPTLNQHWVSVSCLLCISSAISRRWTNAVLLLGRRHRRWSMLTLTPLARLFFFFLIINRLNYSYCEGNVCLNIVLKCLFSN